MFPVNSSDLLRPLDRYPNLPPWTQLSRGFMRSTESIISITFSYHSIYRKYSLILCKYLSLHKRTNKQKKKKKSVQISNKRHDSMQRIAFLLSEVTQPINCTTFSRGLSPSSFPNPISFMIDLSPSSPEVAVTRTQKQ